MPKFSEVLEEKHSDNIERVPMSQTRKAIARNMELSALIPRAVHMDLLNASPLYNVVSKEKPNVEKLGIKLTFLPFIIKAAIEAIKESPNFNSSYDHDTQEIVLKKYYNIGIAAEAPDGLKVIVIKNADKKSIVELAKEIQELHKKILDQTISIEEMRDSTFTITNIGSLGGGFLSVPMINYPEVAILGIHTIRDWPMITDGQVKIGDAALLAGFRPQGGRRCGSREVRERLHKISRGSRFPRDAWLILLRCEFLSYYLNQLRKIFVRHKFLCGLWIF